MWGAFLRFFPTITPMFEQSLEPPEPDTRGAHAETAREPFVPPSVEDLGGLNRLTQLGGSLGG
jgi:hypothetical protein